MQENHEVLAYQQRLNILLTNSEGFADQQQDPLLLRHVLSFIYKNFNKINNIISMSDVLPMLHHSLRLELQKGKPVHLGVYVCALLNVEDKNYNDTVQRCLQILYQILKTLSTEDEKLMQVGNEVFVKLMEILLTKRSTRNNANILACLQLYVTKFNPNFIVHIWLSIKDDLNSNQLIKNAALLQTLIFFFKEFSDHIKEFKQSTEFIKLVEHLLESDQQYHRKSAYSLLKKAHLCMEDQLQSHLNSIQCKDVKIKANFWNICITNLENLEENQSHLIIPSLEQLKKFNISDLTEQIFLDILYRNILRHNNILVRRWILEYLLETITYYSMTNRTQAQFMQALNETALYNIESYMLPTQNMDRFLKCNKSNFLLPFSQIEWKATPLHFWLTHLISYWKTVDVEIVSHEVIVNVASKIRAMQNVILRQANIVLFKNLFSKIIENMELNRYVQFVEALHNVSDPYDDVVILLQKINNCSYQNVDGDTIFTLRFYKILTNQFSKNYETLVNLICKIEEKQNLNGWTIGSLRFLQVFNSHAGNINMQFCENTYGISTCCITLETPLNELYQRFCEKLSKTDEERRLIIEKVTDFYTSLWSFSNMEDCVVRTEEILNCGSFESLIMLTDVLKRHPVFVGRPLLEIFVKRLQDHLKDSKNCTVICANLMEHCKISSSLEDMIYCGLMIVKLDLKNVALFDSVTTFINGNHIDEIFLIKGALISDTKVGDCRIEESYQCKIILCQAKCCLLRSRYKKLICRIEDNKRKANILNYLIDLIENINCKKPRYFANSNEHRSIVHILGVIVELLPNMTCEPEIFSKLWNFLMEHNNQQNVSILYQIALADTIDWDHLVAEVDKQLKATTRTASQELSIIVILYRTFKLENNFNYSQKFKKLIELLWPLTMGPHFQTRLHAQYALVSLYDGFKETKAKNNSTIKANLPEMFHDLCCAIKKTLSQEQIAKLKEDIRFKDLKIDEAFGEVMSFTNAPYDEYNFLRFSRISSEKASAEQKTSGMKTNISINCFVQKKLNPLDDFMPRPNLFSYSNCKAKLYVVASLIDKIPNLGGIARTCEVLGIKNLVISSKKHIEKPDFKNMSMTAENSLNIFEVKPYDLTGFILEKKTEGFKIVGAEQTANSTSFVNFKFPNRSVLLLGHEKEGIPPNLLGFLDYAVEIPQFGMIRSLNVHVTGAIFMWEYCKQHIVGS